MWKEKWQNYSLTIQILIESILLLLYTILYQDNTDTCNVIEKEIIFDSNILGNNSHFSYRQ